MALLLSAATFVSTFLGGLFALRFRDRLPLIVSFSAGAVIGVAFFDLLPEAVGLSTKRYPIRAAELLPESHRRGRPGWSATLAVLGVAVLYVAVRLAKAVP